MKRLAFVLAAAFLLSLFGCGKADESSTTSGSTATAPNNTGIDLGGYEFTWVNGEYGEFALFFESPSNADQQAIKDACDALCAEYGFRFVNKPAGINKISDALITAGKSGSKIGDFIYGEQYAWGRAAINGYLRRLDSAEVRACGMDVLDPSQFDPYAAEAGKLYGQVFSALISGQYIETQTGHLMLFNKALTAGAGYPAERLYRAVRDNEWTWDMFIDICKAAAVRDESGRYTVWGFDSLVFLDILGSIGGPIGCQNGRYVSRLDSPECIAALGMLMRIATDQDVYHVYGSSQSNYVSRFYYGQTVFMPASGREFRHAAGRISLYSLGGIEYGVLPMPRDKEFWYISPIVNFGGYCLQKDNADWEKACFVFGELGRALNDPEAAVERFRKFMPDADSMEMLTDYILPNAKMELLLAAPDLNRAIVEFLNDLLSMDAAAAAEKHAAAFAEAVEEAFGRFNK